MGLPGAGKTSWGQEFAKTNSTYRAKVEYIDFDKYTVRGYHINDIGRSLNYEIKHNDVNIIDGLFLKKEDIEKLLLLFDNINIK